MADSHMASPQLLLGILGHPLAQTMSPILHTWAFAMKKVNGQYSVWDTPPEELSAFMQTLRSVPYSGASVTIPHKEAVIPFLDGLTNTAKNIGAVNTIFWEQGRLLGHNTDMEGFLSPLSGLEPPQMALVLGAGGAARAVLAGLASVGATRVAITARSTAKAEKLATDFSPLFTSITVTPWEERLLSVPEQNASFWAINTTPMGMRGKAEGQSPLPADWFAAQTGKNRLAYDLVYNPLETTFLAFAKRAGWQCRDGLEMFVAQGAAQFRCWTGQDIPVAQAKTMLIRHLAG